MKREEIKLNTPYWMADGSIMYVMAHGVSEGVEHVVTCGHSINPTDPPAGYGWKRWYPVEAVMREAAPDEIARQRETWRNKHLGSADACTLKRCWCTAQDTAVDCMDIYDLQQHMGWTDDTLLKLYHEFFEEHYNKEITNWLRERAKEELLG